MELPLRDAKARFSELVTAAENGERVVITQNGEPVVKLVRCREKCGGIDFDKLEVTRRRLGIEDASTEEAEAMIAAFHNSALSRRVLGVDEDE